MFKSAPIGLAALTFLSGDAQAVKYRPIPGTGPWHKLASHSTWEKPDWPVNYFVPNFGQDSDVNTTQAHLEAAETSVGTKMKASFKQPKGHPTDYFVPNFGQDENIKQSLANTAQSETDLAHKWVPNLEKPKETPKDYFVPNFG